MTMLAARTQLDALVQVGTGWYKGWKGGCWMLERLLKTEGCGASGRLFILFSEALDLFSRSTVGIFPTIMTLCQTQWGGSGSVGTNGGKNSHRPRSLHCV